MTSRTWYEGRSALVTGASSGIGEEFASTLAGRGSNLLLTALPEEGQRMRDIAAKLTEQHRVRVEVVPMDLASPQGPTMLCAAADALSFEPEVLVNSAGFGIGGRFTEAPLDRQLQMIRLNVIGVVALTGLYLPRMVARGDGVVVNVGSTAALQPMPYLATYAATKAFLLSFGEALWAECHAAGVRTITVCSGPVETPFHARAGDTDAAAGAKAALKRRYLTPEMVVASALDAVDKDRPRVVRRLAGAKLVYGATVLATALLSRRRRLLAIERMNHWLFTPTEGADRASALSAPR